MTDVSVAAVALDEANVAVASWNESKQRRDKKLRDMSDRRPAPYKKIKVPYILAYKPTIFGSILTFKLWGLAYTRVMPHSQSRQSARWLSVCAAHCV